MGWWQAVRPAAFIPFRAAAKRGNPSPSNIQNGPSRFGYCWFPLPFLFRQFWHDQRRIARSFSQPVPTSGFLRVRGVLNVIPPFPNLSDGFLASRMVCRPTSANAIELQRVSRTTRALLLMPTAAKPPSLLIPASLPTLSVTRTNTILPLDHPSSLTPTPMCSQLRSAFSACKVFKSPKSEASYHRLHPIYCSPFYFLSGKG
jgi:hypothetical protein